MGSVYNWCILQMNTYGDEKGEIKFESQHV